MSYLQTNYIYTLSLLVLGFPVLATNSLYAANGGWQELPDTRLSDQCPAKGFNGATFGTLNGNPLIYNFPFFCVSVTSAWSGASFDTKRNRLYIWGGGHMNYLGNEIYALDMNGTPSMIRLTDPATPLEYTTDPLQPTIDPSELPPFNGTQPVARETYDGMVYLPGPDKLWEWGGSRSYLGFPDDVTWLFDPLLNTWERQSPSGDIPVPNIGAVSAYDPNTGAVYLHNMMNLYRYTYNETGGQYTQLTFFEPGFAIHMNGVIDPKRKKFILIGHGFSDGSGTSMMYDISPGSSFIAQPINAVGDTGFLGTEAPGLAYDPTIEKVVAWAGGDTLYVLDLDTTPPNWTAKSFPVQPPFASEAPQAHVQGTYGRFAYIAALNAFVVYNATDKNAYLFRWPDTTNNTDKDSDGVVDATDNCIETANPDQLDADNDGYGNICDADLNNDGIVNFADLAIMKSRFFTNDAVSDMNGDGIVNFADLRKLKSFFFQTQGSSG